jgi:hypothetical protein
MGIIGALATGDRRNSQSEQYSPHTAGEEVLKKKLAYALVTLTIDKGMKHERMNPKDNEGGGPGRFTPLFGDSHMPCYKAPGILVWWLFQF